MSFPRYSTYKTSGVEWLGDVPEHWAMDRIKRSTIGCRNGVWGNEAKEDETDIPCVRVANFDRQQLRVELNDPTIRSVLQNERSGRVLSRGDLLLEKSGGGELQPVGCVVLFDDDRPSVCSNFVARMQIAPGMSSSYWRYLHAAAYAVRLNTRSIKQTSGIQNLDQQQYLDEKAGFPPSDEQIQIAAFLDRETTKINALVAEQQRLIDLLKEKRQAVISHAVTKGLNPHAPMKPSGIEWLGNVPAHWRVLRLKTISPRISGRLVYQPAQYFVAEGVPFLMGNNVTERGIKWEDLKFIPDEVNKQFSQHSLREGDVITVRVGAPGVTCVVPKEADGLNCGSLMIIRRSPSFSSRWLSSVMNSFVVRSQIDLVQYGAAQEQINITDAVDFMIPTPPLDEQPTIAAFLDAETGRFDTLTAEAGRAIDLLQERRTALISAAVTGKIDVRELAETEAA